MLLKDCATEWLALHARTWRPETHRQYFSAVSNHLAPFFGEREIDSITRVEVLNYLSGVVSTKHANKLLQILKMIFKEAVNAGYLEKNLIASIKPFRVEHEEVITFSPEEIERVIEVAKQDVWWRAYLAVEISYGLRIGELCGLQWRDLDDRYQTLRVERQASSNGQVVPWTKSDAGTRTLPLTEEVYHELCELRESNRLLGWYRNNGFIFSRTNGNRCRPQTVQKNFHELLALAEVEDRKHHAMRHTCATILLKEGAPFDVVSRLLGHSEISVTVNMYRHVAQPEVRDAAALIWRAISRF